MTVLVGISGATDSRDAIQLAIQLAFQEALYRDTDLVALIAYPSERGWSPAVKPGVSRLTRADDRAVADAVVREAVADALGDAASSVHYKVVADQPGRALVSAARTTRAQLIVLATRRGKAAKVLGLVSQYVLRQAPCPVLAIPPAGKGPRAHREHREHREAGHTAGAGRAALRKS
jgi:nucleotide-binding universal stress UspA family protein